MLPNNIRAIRTARGLTLEQLAELVRVSAGQVSRWETKDVDIPTSRLAALAGALQCTIDALLSAPGSPSDHSSDASEDTTLQFFDQEDGNAPTAPLSRSDGIKEAYSARYQIPIYSTVDFREIPIESGIYEGLSIERIKPFSYLYRTQRLSKMATTFGFYFKGHSMEPAYREGDFILVSNMFPPRIGDDVLLTLRSASDRDAMQAKQNCLLRRLTRRTADFIELEQFAPALTLRIPIDQVGVIYRVLKVDDALPVYIP